MPLACEQQAAAALPKVGYLNLPQVPTDWNNRAPALRSVLLSRVRVQRIEGDGEYQAGLHVYC